MTKPRVETGEMLEMLRLHLRYCKKTSLLFWVKAPRGKQKLVGTPITNTASHGYVQLQFASKKFLAHRVIWALHNNRWPNYFLDHRNRVRTDNRIKNLREATQTQNMQNVNRLRKICPARGVHASGEKWCAYISVKRKRVHLGTYPTIQMASDARAEAERKYYTHRITA